MPSLEAVCGRLFGHPGWVSKALWGGALCFIPVLNLFSLGYLLEYTVRLRQNKEWHLPDWKEMEPVSLFSGGLQVFLLILAYAGCPVLIGLLASMLVDLLTFSFLGIVSYFPPWQRVHLCPFSFSIFHACIRSRRFIFGCMEGKSCITSCQGYGTEVNSPDYCLLGCPVTRSSLYTAFRSFLALWVLLAYSSALNFSKMNQD